MPTADPASILFYPGARRLLDRAYARPGQWVGTRVAYPSPQNRGWLDARGIDPEGPDPVRLLPGKGLDAKDRWTRAFVRALYHEHKWFSGKPGGGWRKERRATPRSASALQVQVGRRLAGGRQAGTLYVPGRAVRIRVLRGGERAEAAVRRMPEAQRYTGSGAPRWADPRIREWETS